MKTIGFLRLLERSTEERGEKEPKDGKKVLESLVRYQVGTYIVSLRDLCFLLDQLEEFFWALNFNHYNNRLFQVTDFCFVCTDSIGIFENAMTRRQS